MDHTASNESELVDFNNKLLDKLFLMTKKCREVENFAEDHKQVVKQLVEIMEDPVKLQEILSENFAIKYEPGEKDQIKDLTNKLEGLEIESHEKEDQIQILNFSKITMNEEIGALLKQIDKMESESINLKAYVTKVEKLKEEVMVLKLDLKEKCKEYDILCEKMKKLEMKAAAAAVNNPVQNRSYPIPQSLPQTIVIQGNPSHDYINLNNYYQNLSRQYHAVCQERDLLKLRMESYMNHKESIIQSQNNEIARLQSFLSQAESKICERSMELLASNCNQFQQDLKLIKLKMGVTDDMLEAARQQK